MSHPARLGLWLALLLVSSAALAGRVVVAAGATPGPPSFRAAASAEGVRASVIAEGAPVTNHVVDAASPLAQASLDSTSGSAALGSVAYPGDLVVTAPGLLAGFSGGQTSDLVPPYPLIAVAGSTTTPKSAVDVPGASMRAAADGRHADASAATGAGTEAGSAATVGVSATVIAGEDDVVTSSASSDVSSVRIGPLVLGRLAADSVTVRGPDAEVTRESSFEVTGVSIEGIDVRITSEGLMVADTALPIPVSAVQTVLDGAGISLRWIEEEETEDGIVSAGLVVTMVQDLPAVVTPATFAFTFGRAAASVSTVSLPAVGLDVPGTGAAPPTRPSAGGPTQSSVAPSPAVAAPAAPAPAAPTQPASLVRTGAAPLFDLTTFYLVLMVAAACAGAVLELIRHLGVRLRWT